MGEPGRTVTLVLCRDTELLGALPPVGVPVPWWPEVRDVVAAARDAYGIDVAVLRLLAAPSDRRSGGHVTYLAEVAGVPELPLREWSGPDPLVDQPHRQSWARPGGPAACLDWAQDRLREQGRPPTGPPEQIKSWNLSALWRIPTASGWVWLKATPPFLDHEGAVAALLGGPHVPVVLAHRPGLALMDEIAGEDNFETTGAALRPMVELLTSLQLRFRDRAGTVLEAGAPDRRLPRMIARIEQVADGWGPALDRPERAALDRLVEGLARRASAVADCGVPDTLVHGDFHPGNVRGSRDRYVILDWGDSFFGPPLVDDLAFTRPLGAEDRRAAHRWFVEAWQDGVPGSDPDRAAELLRPVLPLYAAVVYDDFCANIEPDERIYHAQDVPAMLRQAAAESGDDR